MVTDYYLPTLGGVQTVIKAHREELERAGHEVTVFAPLTDDPADPHLERLPTARGFAPDGYPFTWSPAAAEEMLRRRLPAIGAEVVHVHTEMFAATAAYRAAHALGLPLVQTMHGRIDVYPRSVLPIPSVTTALLTAMHRRQLPHDATRIDPAMPYTRTRQARRMWRLMVSQADRADHVIVPSDHFAAKLRAQGVQAPVTVLSNGLEQSVLDAIGAPEPRALAPAEPLRVMWCGRLSPEKRPEAFVDAISRVDGVEAHMYGDGIRRRQIARRAGALPPGRLQVHGGVPQHEVLAAMRRAHVLVSSSLDFDNQPMVLLEAVASGLPVIIADPDLAEMLPSRGALVAPTPDAGGLASAIRSVAEHPDRIAAMSAAAADHRARTAQSTHLERLLDVYRRAIEHRGTAETHR